MVTSGSAADEAELEVGDGGLVPWTATLMDDAKERCFISCMATERLAALADEASP